MMTFMLSNPGMWLGRAMFVSMVIDDGVSTKVGFGLLIYKSKGQEDQLPLHSPIKNQHLWI